MHHVLVWGSVVIYFIGSRVTTDPESSGQTRGAASSVAAIPVYWLMLFLYIGVSVFSTISYILFRRLPLRCSAPPHSGELLAEPGGEARWTT
jgi:hypothetical protein